MRIALIIILLFLGSPAWAANYTLDIINIDEVGSNNRIKFAYPGIEYKVRIFAYGGTYPFAWSLTENTTCGCTIDSQTGVVTWSNPSVGDTGCTVEINVTDAELSTDTESYTVEVTSSTDRFIWMDADNSVGGRDGSYAKPYQDFDDFWAAGGHGGKILYMMTGTYDFSGITGSDGRSVGAYRISYSSSNQPIAFLEHPGETVVFDGTRDWNGDNTGRHWYGSGDDLYFYGIRFTNLYAYAFEIYNTDFSIWHDCEFDNYESAYTYVNDACISWGNTGQTSKVGIGGCSFSGGSGSYATGIKTYAVDHQVVEDCYFDSMPDHGISWKDDSSNNVARHNVFSGNNIGVGMAGYGDNGCDENEISFNWFNGDTIPIYANDSGNIGTTHIFRNTVSGTPIFRLLETDDGIFYLVNNVIINSSSDTSPSQDFFSNKCRMLYWEEGSEATILSTRFSFSGNLLGVASDNLIDANGLLVNREYIGTYGWETGGASSTSPIGIPLCNSR